MAVAIALTWLSSKYIHIQFNVSNLKKENKLNNSESWIYVTTTNKQSISKLQI